MPTACSRPSPAPTRTSPTSSTVRWRRAATSPRGTSTPVAGSPCSAPRSPTTLFGDVDPLGRQVSIAGVRFRVIGVFDERRLDLRGEPRRRGPRPGDGRAATVRRRPDRRAGRQGADARLDRAAAGAHRRGAGGEVPRRDVLGGHPDPDPRHHRHHPRPADPGARRHRRHLAARRWRRGLEHHAGLGRASGPARSGCARRSARGSATSRCSS